MSSIILCVLYVLYIGFQGLIITTLLADGFYKDY